MQLSSDGKRRLALLAPLDVALAIYLWIVGLYFFAGVFTVLLVVVTIVLAVSRTENPRTD